MSSHNEREFVKKLATNIKGIPKYPSKEEIYKKEKNRLRNARLLEIANIIHVLKPTPSYN